MSFDPKKNAAIKLISILVGLDIVDLATRPGLTWLWGGIPGKSLFNDWLESNEN